MDWVLASPQIHNTFVSLGYIEGNHYHINDDCLSTLQEILSKLMTEDRTLRTFRRAVGFGQNVKKDLLPILIHVKDNPKIIETTIKILVNLTIPVECLLSIDDLSKSNVGRHTIYELNNLLLSSKEAFTDGRATNAVIKYIKQICEKDIKMPQDQVENVNNSLLLLRNILHIPVYQNGVANPSVHGSSQNQILWNLFTQSIDKILLCLITSTYGAQWSVTMVQLIALIYKDQHVGTLQKLLNIWFESSLSESSDDNESNTSPPEKGTSYTTSDSSDNGGGGSSQDSGKWTASSNKDSHCQSTSDLPKKHASGGTKHAMAHQSHTYIQRSTESENHIYSTETTVYTNGAKRESLSGTSEFSDCGYVTQLENQESISTSSNDDDAPQQKPVHQKPHTSKQRHNAKQRPQITVQEHKDKRRKKLVKRGKTNIINMKGLVHHTPTDEDITIVLKEFTVDFLLKGYSSLVHSLYKQLLFDLHLQIDTSHFFWLVTYFLKFAAQLELDHEHVSQILSFEIISYLTYEGVHLCEQIQLLSKTKSSELIPSLRRMHLVVTAIREFIQTVDTYGKIGHLSKEDKAQLTKLQVRICCTDELRCLLVLLIRHYQPDVHSKQYLQDLIVTNHILLLFLDNGMKQPEVPATNMLNHIKQFATVEVMHQYGLLLSDFRSNGEFVNDCIFTMMHHVGGDLDQITTLFQPNILKTFSLIWETDFEICDDWSDLVDYVINQFIKTPRPIIQKPIYEQISLPESTIHRMSQNTQRWTQEERDKLSWYYMQSKNNSCAIDSIASLFREDGIIKSDESIIEQLHEQEIISRDEYLKLLDKSERMDDQDSQMASCSSDGRILPVDDVELLKESLIKQNMKNALDWLQKVLLETCFAKHCLNNKTKEESIHIHDGLHHVIEPIPFHNNLVNQSIPIVPWNNEQSTAIHNQTFLHLLHRLGFHLPADSGKLFVRIPNFWTTDVLLHIAERLGPIDTANLKFVLSDVGNGVQPDNAESMESSSMFLNENGHKLIRPCTLLPNDSSFRIPRTKQTHSLVQFTPLPSSNFPTDQSKCRSTQQHNWLNLIMKSKTSRYEQEKVCDTASVASDLTRMYVSDEDDKHSLL